MPNANGKMSSLIVHPSFFIVDKYLCNYVAKSKSIFDKRKNRTKEKKTFCVRTIIFLVRFLILTSIDILV